MVKNRKAEGLPLAPLADEHAYADMHSARKTLATQTPVHTPPVPTTLLSSLDIAGAIWAIDETHHGHMELEFLLEFSIWCPDGLNISEFRQATGHMNITQALAPPAPSPVPFLSGALKALAAASPAPPPVPPSTGAVNGLA